MKLKDYILNNVLVAPKVKVVLRYEDYDNKEKRIVTSLNSAKWDFLSFDRLMDREVLQINLQNNEIVLGGIRKDV